MKNYRFKEVKLRAFNKDTKKMIYTSETEAFVLTSKGFSIISIDAEGNASPDSLGGDENSVLMSSVNFRDKTNTDIYEGDVVFFRRVIAKKLLPMLGIVMAKDFSYSVNSGQHHFIMDYADKDVEVLGNVFETSDEDLAAKAEILLKKFGEK